MPGPFIRPYEDKDREAAAHICRATLPPSLAASEDAVRICPYVWTHQFTLLSPSTCFVLDDGSAEGKAVGYVIGCPDAFAFARDYPRYVSEVLRGWGAADVPAPPQLETRESWVVEKPAGGSGGDSKKAINGMAMAQLAYKPEWLLGLPRGQAMSRAEEMVSTYRGMMHIDLLEPYQGQGWGRIMINAFLESIRKACDESESRGAGSAKLDRGQGINIGIHPENTKVVPFYERCGFRVYEGDQAQSGVSMVRDF